MTALERTVEIMHRTQIGGMLYHIINESCGSNAGTHEGESCCAANFYFDIQTGEIVYFGNEPQIPSRIRDEYQHGQFRIVNDRAKGERILSYELPFATVEARTLVELAILRYNKRAELRESA